MGYEFGGTSSLVGVAGAGVAAGSVDPVGVGDSAVVVVALGVLVVVRLVRVGLGAAGVLVAVAVSEVAASVGAAVGVPAAVPSVAGFSVTGEPVVEESIGVLSAVEEPVAGESAGGASARDASAGTASAGAGLGFAVDVLTRFAGVDGVARFVEVEEEAEEVVRLVEVDVLAGLL
ncbi:hypothetical protein [Sphaerisporangium corydalis]|uniref:hypothetical protein n=1 Tax=Sphaerisporangium corydalis TaxID=1441875 RepID=UPI0021D0BAE2|nr:hypothetical protein [Sphaerisporangium corydalis]